MPAPSLTVVPLVAVWNLNPTLVEPYISTPVPLTAGFKVLTPKLPFSFNETNPVWLSRVKFLAIALPNFSVEIKLP